MCACVERAICYNIYNVVFSPFLCARARARVCGRVCVCVCVVLCCVVVVVVVVVVAGFRLVCDKPTVVRLDSQK